MTREELEARVLAQECLLWGLVDKLSEPTAGQKFPITHYFADKIKPINVELQKAGDTARIDAFKKEYDLATRRLGGR